MRRSSGEQKEIDQFSSSHLKLSTKKNEISTNVSRGEQDREVLIGSCTSTEDQQSQQQKGQGDGKETRQNSDQDFKKQLIPLGVILSSNSDIQGDMPQDFLVETPTNCNKPLDAFEMQEKMESKKYYTMSCIKKKNQFQKKNGYNKEYNTDGLGFHQKKAQLSYRDSFNQDKHDSSLQSRSSFASSKESQMYSQPFSEGESSTSSFASSSQGAPYVTAFDIGASPKKKRIEQMENSDLKSSNLIQQSKNNDELNSYLEEIEQSKEDNYRMLQDIYNQLESEMNADNQQPNHGMNSFIEQMKRQFDMEKRRQCISNASGRSSCSSMFSQTSSTHQIWDNTPLHQRGIDTEQWIDLKSIEGQFKQFTLFHLYKARCAQLDGVAISNHAVVDIMRRFIRNKRVQDIGGYPWFSFDDKLDYVDIQEDLEKDPLCKVFLEYTKEYASKRRGNKGNNVEKENIMTTEQSNNQIEERQIKSTKPEIQLSRDQLKTELSQSLMNASSNKLYPQTFITELIQPNAPRNQYHADKKKEYILSREYLKTEQSQNTVMKDTYEKIDLENIHAVTQASEDNNDKNNTQKASSAVNIEEIQSDKKSPQFAQNFYPNFTMNGTQISAVALNTQPNNQNNSSSFIGAIYNNLNKCETTNSFIAEQGYYTQREGDFRKTNKSFEQSPLQKDLDYIQKRQKQILEKITSTPLRMKNEHSLNAQPNNKGKQNSPLVKTIKKNADISSQSFYNTNKTKSNSGNSKERNRVSSLSSNNQRNRVHKSTSSHNQLQETPLKNQKYREYSFDTSSKEKRNSKSSNKMKNVTQSLNGPLPKSNKISGQTKYQKENYYNNNNKNINQKQKSAGSIGNDLSFSKNEFFLRNSADSLHSIKERPTSLNQQSTKKKVVIINKNAINTKTPNKREADNSYSLTRKDFLKYFHNDYAKYYNKRKFVSSSCEKMIRLSSNANNNQTTAKKKQIKQSPNGKDYQQSQSTERISKQHNILNSILKNQRIDENERIKLLSNYISNHHQASTEDSRSRYDNFTKNVITSEFNIDSYLNTNLDKDLSILQNKNSKINQDNKFKHNIYDNISNKENINPNIKPTQHFKQTNKVHGHNILNASDNNISTNLGTSKENKQNHYQFSHLLQQLNKQKWQEQESMTMNFYKHLHEIKPAIMNRSELTFHHPMEGEKSSLNNMNCTNTMINNNVHKNKLSVYKAFKNKQILKPYQQHQHQQQYI